MTMYPRGVNVHVVRSVSPLMADLRSEWVLVVIEENLKGVTTSLPHLRSLLLRLSRTPCPSPTVFKFLCLLREDNDEMIDTEQQLAYRNGGRSPPPTPPHDGCRFYSSYFGQLLALCMIRCDLAGAVPRTGDR
jgi:hypothetical protein